MELTDFTKLALLTFRTRPELLPFFATVRSVEAIVSASKPIRPCLAHRPHCGARAL
jgi:hypothetical protein